MTELDWITALVVEDDALVRLDLADSLQAAGYKTVEAASADEAIAVLQSNSDIRVVFIDIQMPGMSGLATFAALQELEPAPPCCFLSGKISSSAKVALLKLGALHVFQKPFVSVLGFVKQVQDLVSDLGQ